LDDYALSGKQAVSKRDVESYIKTVSKFIVDNIGGTEFGPAVSFRDITRAIVRDTKETLAIASPVKMAGIREPIFVSVPVRLGWKIESCLFGELLREEQDEIAESAKTIYQTYMSAIESLD
jgi:malate/lactate dehydrogenase